MIKLARAIARLNIALGIAILPIGNLQFGAGLFMLGFGLLTLKATQ